jgi:hypothetical protein
LPRFLSGLIIKFDVFLHFTIKEPKILLFHGVGALPFDGLVDNANCGSVFDIYRVWWLWMSKFSKSKAKTLACWAFWKRVSNLDSMVDKATG